MNMEGKIQIVRDNVGVYFVESTWLWVEYNLGMQGNNSENMYDPDLDFVIHKSVLAFPYLPSFP